MTDSSVHTIRHYYSDALVLRAPAALLAGEDAAAYDDLAARIAAAVRPADILEEIWVRDVVDLVWDVVRLRRLKAGLFVAAASDGMAAVLRGLGAMFADGMARRWAAREPTAVGDADEYLAAAGLGPDAVVARTFAVNIDTFERIDRLIMAAEARRAAALREIDRRRAALAAALREAVQQAEAGRNVQDAEFVEVASPHRAGGEAPA